MRNSLFVPCILGLFLTMQPALLADGWGSSCGTCKTCVATPTKVKVKKVCYSYKCIDYCKTRCSFGFGLGLFGGGNRRSGHQYGCGCGCHHVCGDCGHHCPAADCPNCGRVRTKRVLLKKVISYECPGYKCKVVHQAPPCCPSSGCCRPSGGSGRVYLGPPAGSGTKRMPRSDGATKIPLPIGAPVTTTPYQNGAIVVTPTTTYRHTIVPSTSSRMPVYQPIGN